MSVLSWDKPLRRVNPGQWRSYQADGCPPGAYEPNMSDEDRYLWKARMVGVRSGPVRVEIRKSTGPRHGSVQMLIIVNDQGVTMSMNGRADLSNDEWAQLADAVGEARRAIQGWHDEQAART
jgi:hypothetical protein